MSSPNSGISEKAVSRGLIVVSALLAGATYSSNNENYRIPGLVMSALSAIWGVGLLFATNRQVQPDGGTTNGKLLGGKPVNVGGTSSKTQEQRKKDNLPSQDKSDERYERFLRHVENKDRTPAAGSSKRPTQSSHLSVDKNGQQRKQASRQPATQTRQSAKGVTGTRTYNLSSRKRIVLKASRFGLSPSFDASKVSMKQEGNACFMTSSLWCLFNEPSFRKALMDAIKERGPTQNGQLFSLCLEEQGDLLIERVKQNYRNHSKNKPLNPDQQKYLTLLELYSIIKHVGRGDKLPEGTLNHHVRYLIAQVAKAGNVKREFSRPGEAGDPIPVISALVDLVFPAKSFSLQINTKRTYEDGTPRFALSEEPFNGIIDVSHLEQSKKKSPDLQSLVEQYFKPAFDSSDAKGKCTVDQSKKVKGQLPFLVIDAKQIRGLRVVNGFYLGDVAYVLTGFIQHLGPEQNHYIATISPNDRKWVRCDDLRQYQDQKRNKIPDPNETLDNLRTNGNHLTLFYRRVSEES